MWANWEQMRPGRRYGNAVPRLWTPPLRELTPETSLGFDFIDFAVQVLHLDPFPWQRWLAIHMLELTPDGLLRFRTTITLVGRQNGKSLFMQILAIYMMVAEGWPLVLGTAQDLGTAEAVWDETVGMLDDDPELAGLVRKVTQVNGKKALRLVTNERYLVKAANRKAGRGLRANLVVLDELREQQTWAAWAAITNTTNAQERALVVGISNAGDVLSVVLWHHRLIAHRALGDPDGIDREGALALTAPNLDNIGEEPVDVIRRDPLAADDELEEWDDEGEEEIAEDVDAFYDDEDDDLEDDPFGDLDDADMLGLFEWSAAPGRTIRDRDGWQESCPSLGWIPVMERNIRGKLSQPEWVFRTEILCQWPDGTLNGPFPAGAWERSQNTPFERADGSLVVADGNEYGFVDDRLQGPLAVCIEQSDNRAMYSIVAVGKRRDGLEQGEVIAYRSGSDWIEDFLMHDPRYRGRITRVTGQTRGAPVSAFMATLAEHSANKAHPFTIPVVPWGGADLTIATSLLYDAIVGVITDPDPTPTLRHNVQEVLDVAAGNAVSNQLSGGWVVDRAASEQDTAPLMGLAGALWLWRQHANVPLPPPPPSKVVRSTGDGYRPTPARGGSPMAGIQRAGF